MGTGYYDRQGNELDRAGMVGAFGSIEDRRVDRTQVDADVSVSTVHLVLDHSFGDGPPLIFETMVFGGDHDQDCWRYSTEEQARAGHAAAVAWVRGEGPEPSGDAE
jgi:hypothetical protein